MPEPVDPVSDWLVTRGCKRLLTVSAYAPATDTFAAPAGVYGTRDGRNHEPAAVGGGGEEEGRVTTTLFLAVAGARPPVRSKVTDGADVWRIESYARDPIDGVVSARCVLL